MNNSSSQLLTPDDLIKAAQRRKSLSQTEQKKVERFLICQNGVEKVSSRANSLDFDVWLNDTHSGLPLGSLPNGLNVSELNSYETQYLYREIFLEKVYKLDDIVLGDAPTIIDAGANIGMFSLFTMLAKPHAKIISLEPNPHAYAALHANIQAHNIPATSLPVALGPEPCSATFTLYPSASVFSGLGEVRSSDQTAIQAAIETEVNDPGSQKIVEDIARNRLVGGHKVSVEIVTIGDLIKQFKLTSIDVLKLDIEGNELDVLSSLSSDEWAIIRHVFMEVHKPEHLSAAKQLFIENGFDCHTVEVDALSGSGFINLYASAKHRALTTTDLEQNKQVSPAPLCGEQRLRLALKSFWQNKTPSPSLFFHTVETNHDHPTTQDKASSDEVLSPDKVRGVALIWHEILGIDPAEQKILLSDDFFALGGTSIMAVRMLSALHKEYGVLIDLDEVYSGPQLAAIVKHIFETSE